MGRVLALLSITLLGSFAPAAEVCLQKSLVSKVDLATLWPLEEFKDRHSQIQVAIQLSRGNINFCFDHYGPLPDPIEFLVSEEGRVYVIQTSVTSKSAKCIEQMFWAVMAGDYPCALNVVYEWKGNFPLINGPPIDSD